MYCYGEGGFSALQVVDIVSELISSATTNMLYLGE